MNELDDKAKTQYITKIIDKLDSVNKNLDDYLVTIDNLMSWVNATLASNLKTASGEVSSASGKLNNGVGRITRQKQTHSRPLQRYSPRWIRFIVYSYPFAVDEYNIIKRTSNGGRDCKCCE